MKRDIYREFVLALVDRRTMERQISEKCLRVWAIPRTPIMIDAISLLREYPLIATPSGYSSIVELVKKQTPHLDMCALLSTPSLALTRIG